MAYKSYKYSYSGIKYILRKQYSLLIRMVSLYSVYSSQYVYLVNKYVVFLPFVSIP